VSWYDVDARAADEASGQAAPAVATQIPTRVRFQGMPARRYWELEDAAVHWPSIDAGPGDVGRLLFIEFGLTFSDDWLLVPFEVPAGSLSRITSLVVTDTFGVRTRVRSAADLDGPDSPWRFLELSRAANIDGPVLFVPPAAGAALVGPERDAVDYATDEGAHLVWAIDRNALGADGIAREVAAPPVEPTPPAPAPAPDGAPRLVYRLGPVVPASFHPYRLRVGTSGPELARALVPGRPVVDRPDLPDRLSIGVTPSRPIRVRSAAVLMRSADGAYHLHTSRAVVPAPPSPAPDVLFDQLEPRS
jgi:hypothetical protein